MSRPNWNDSTARATPETFPLASAVASLAQRVASLSTVATSAAAARGHAWACSVDANVVNVDAYPDTAPEDSAAVSDALNVVKAAP